MRLISGVERCRPSRTTRTASRLVMSRNTFSLYTTSIYSRSLHSPSSLSLPIFPTRSFGSSPALSSGSFNGLICRRSYATHSAVPKCPEILASIPIYKRPLIPGFYKTIAIRDAKLAEEIKKTVLESTPPLIGAFLQRTASEEEGEIQTITALETVYETGTLCSIINAIPGPNGSLTLVVYPHYRIRATSLAHINDTLNPDTKRNNSIQPSDINESSVPSTHRAESNEATEKPRCDAVALLCVSPLLQVEENGDKDDIIAALAQECLGTLASIAKQNTFIREHLSSFSSTLPGSEDPVALADLIAVLCSGPPELLQQLLEAPSIEARLRTALELLLREQEATQLQATLRKSVEERLTMRHREALLVEQMKAIQKELGASPSSSVSTADSLREKAVAQFQSRITPLREHVLQNDDPRIKTLVALIDEEMNRMGGIEPSSGEFGIIRTYLDWLTSLPWLQPSDNASFPSLGEARAILEKDHWGLLEVKQRIIELLASIHLSTPNSSKCASSADTSSRSSGILLLVGPPGIGKTSIGTSIARALGRPFFKIALGGLNDVAELRGHRRTYLGAMPGKIVQALRQTQSLCPVVLLDEIDKIAMLSAVRAGGDPSGALLEALDGTMFTDHFLDFPVDLSGVTFIATANTTEGIPAPLLDRMSMVSLSSYTMNEKLAIAERHLLPRALQSSGIETKREEWGDVALPSATMSNIIESWCRESGVRQLRQAIERICRRIAAEALEKGLPFSIDGIEQTIAVGEHSKRAIIVKEHALPVLLGLPHFPHEEKMLALPPGVVAGLAWTPYGGSILHIEVAAVGDEKGNLLSLPLRTTGHLGKVMKESAEIAHSVARIYAGDKIRNDAQENDKNTGDRVEKHSSAIHMHVPEGATPKDGPSAGMAMAVALLSLSRKESVRSGVGFTGELTLSGRILRIGGLKEKVLAAKREGLKEVIFPAANAMEWAELEQSLPEPLVGPSAGLLGHPVSTFTEVMSLCFTSAR